MEEISGVVSVNGRSFDYYIEEGLLCVLDDAGEDFFDVSWGDGFDANPAPMVIGKLVEVYIYGMNAGSCETKTRIERKQQQDRAALLDLVGTLGRAWRGE